MHSIRTDIVIMHVGIGVAIAGAVALIAIAVDASSSPFALAAPLAGAAAWGVGTASAIFGAAQGAIKKLRKRIEELEADPADSDAEE